MGDRHEKKEVTVGIRIAESTKRRLDKIVEDQDRTIGYVARELMLRGLAMYEQDGVVRAPETLHRAPVVATIGGKPSRAEVRKMAGFDEIKPARRQTVPQLKQKAK